MLPIGIIHSPFKEKFTIPRQPGLIAVPATLEFYFPYGNAQAFLGLSQFSHLWVIFLFHKTAQASEKFKSTVRPPRLGGNMRQGVFATRSPYRPNNIGLSLVKIESIEKNKIIITGGDFLDQTPILDIKPYIKEIECVPEANSTWIDVIPKKNLIVAFEQSVRDQLSELEYKYLKEILALDPRPAFHQDNKKTYSAKLFDFDLHFKIVGDTCNVFKLTR